VEDVKPVIGNDPVAAPATIAGDAHVNAGSSNGLPRQVTGSRAGELRTRQASGGSTTSGGSNGKSDLGLLWQVGKVVGKGVEGKGQVSFQVIWA
jgi:hypothetical protein